MTCDCLTQIDERLKDQNLTLAGYAFMLALGSSIPTVPTKWIDPDKAPRGERKRPPAMMANYCPFCGVAVKAEKEKG